MSIESDLKKHQVYVTRLAASQRKLVEQELQQIRRLANIEIVSGTSGEQLKKNLRAATQGFADKMTGNISKIAEKESKYIARRLKVEPIPSSKLSNKVLNENMRLNIGSQEKSRRSVSATYSQFARRKADEINQIIRDGRAQGLSTIDIMKNVDERIAGRQTAQARVLAETSTLYASNVAQRETINQSRDEVRFTLGESQDHTEVCLGLANQIFKTDEAPTPPLHWGCNSYLVPLDKIVPTKDMV